MSNGETTGPANEIQNYMPDKPPFIWPDARVHVGTGQYRDCPPYKALFSEADLISGILVGVADRSIKWIDGLMQHAGPCKLCLVVVLNPAGPTREAHLISLNMLAAACKQSERKIEVRLLPVFGASGIGEVLGSLPPTVLMAHDSQKRKTLFCIGSVGDAGMDDIRRESFNIVFQPDDALRDSWRRWFEYYFRKAAPLTPETVHIPHLVPAKGDPAATAMWEDYARACAKLQNARVGTIAVDAKTGEVTAEVDGKQVESWDNGKTKLDPLAQQLQEVYARALLVTVDETTRIKPLEIPVKATLLGQQAQRAVGNLRQRQSFSLTVLDETTAKEINKCRQVTDLVELLTYPLSTGNRLIPEAAKDLLENEIKARNQRGAEILKVAMGGQNVESFIKKRQDSIRRDLDEMYRQLGMSGHVPDAMFQEVLTEVKGRLTKALGARITPRTVYNRILPPDLTAGAPAENWSQPFSLLIRSARLMREAKTDNFFPRKFSKLAFAENDFMKAMDIFGDVIVEKPDRRRAEDELAKLDKIEEGPQNSKEQCNAVWGIIKGDMSPQ